MSGKRFFYTDPLAAAWMANHFGMLVIAEHENWLNGKLVDVTTSTASNFPGWGDYSDWFRSNKFYIHPDSLHLLGIQVGDLVRAHGEFGQVHLVSHSLKKQMRKDPPEWWYVVQRKGKVFHWPESE